MESAIARIKKVESLKLMNLYEIDGSKLFLTNGPFSLVPLRSYGEWEGIRKYTLKRPAYDHPVIYFDGFSNVYTKDGFVLDRETNELKPMNKKEVCVFLYKSWEMFFMEDRLVVRSPGFDIRSNNTMSSIQLLTAECDAPIAEGWFGYRTGSLKAENSFECAMTMMEIVFKVTLPDGETQKLRFPEVLDVLKESKSFEVDLLNVNGMSKIPVARHSATVAMLACESGFPRRVLRCNEDVDGFCISSSAHVAQVEDDSVFILQHQTCIRWTNAYVKD